MGVGLEGGDLTIAGGIFGNTGIPHGVHHGAQVDGGSGPKFGFHCTARVALGFNTIDPGHVEGVVTGQIEPTSGNGEINEVGRAQEVITLLKIEGDVADISRVGHAYVIGPESLGNPQALAAGKVEENPAFLFIGE